MKTKNKKQALIIFISFICVTTLIILYSQRKDSDPNIIETKNNTAHINSNQFTWKTAYDITFNEETISVTVLIKLIPVGDVRNIQIEQVKKSWKDKINLVWSNQYAMKTPSGNIYPIIISAKFIRLNPHHEVIIRKKSKKVDEYNWGINTNANIIAHEFGHMIGAYDEYPNGAIDPVTKKIDMSNIMGDSKGSSKTYARHYKSIEKWFNKTVKPSSKIIAFSPKT